MPLAACTESNPPDRAGTDHAQAQAPGVQQEPDDCSSYDWPAQSEDEQISARMRSSLDEFRKVTIQRIIAGHEASILCPGPWIFVIVRTS